MSITIQQLEATVYRLPRPPWEEISGIVLHDTDGSTAAGARAHFDKMAKQNQARGYHYLIDRDGEVLQLVPDNERTSHARSANRAALGVAFVGGDRRAGTINQKQLAAAQELILELTRRHPTIGFIMGHRHVLLDKHRLSGKLDPRIPDSAIAKLGANAGLRFDEKGTEMLRLNEDYKQRETYEAFQCLAFPNLPAATDWCEMSLRTFREGLPPTERRQFEASLGVLGLLEKKSR